jgi:hypothetical protein
MTSDVIVNAGYAIQTFNLQLTNLGNGVGTLTPNPAGTNCGAGCYTYNYNSSVTVTEVPGNTAATLSTFGGWGGDCSGSGACSVLMTAARSVTGLFNMNPNLAFVTSTMTTGNMGGLGGADTICTNRANAAGLAGTFKAWLAGRSLGTASGWIRVDGKALANLQSDLNQGNWFYPLRINESGGDIGESLIYTGQSGGGDCTGWTVTTGFGVDGYSDGQGGLNLNIGSIGCSATVPIFCVGTDRPAGAAPPPPPTSHRTAFISNAIFASGGGLAAADALCQSEAQSAGLSGTYLAALATVGKTAASRFNASAGSAPWFRVDGAAIATNVANTFTATYWDSAVNLTAAGTQQFGNYQTFSGAATATTAGANTCADWTVSTGNTVGGRAGFSKIANWFGFDTNLPCNAMNAHIACFQQ